jgi:hypothetical protein
MHTHARAHTHTACGIAHLHLTPGILGGLVGALASLAVTGDVWPDTAIVAVLLLYWYQSTCFAGTKRCSKFQLACCHWRRVARCCQFSGFTTHYTCFTGTKCKYSRLRSLQAFPGRGARSAALQVYISFFFNPRSKGSCALSILKHT